MYQFEIEYTLEDYEAFSRLAAKTFRKKPMLIRRAVCTFFAVSYLILGILFFFLQRWVLGVIFGGGGLFFAVMTIRWHPLMARRMKKNSLKDMGTLMVALEENGIRNHHQKGEGFTPYDAITDAFYFWEYYFLALDDRQGMLLPERTLTQGDPAELKAFLGEKLKQEIKDIY